MSKRYYCIMSHYPIGEGLVNVQYRNKSLLTDINNSFWEESKVFKTDKEFNHWIENHPFGWNLIQVERIEEYKGDRDC